MLLGIPDPWVWGAYVLCILSTLLCVVYGLVNWNRGGEAETQEIQEEIAWEKKEGEIDERLT